MPTDPADRDVAAALPFEKGALDAIRGAGCRLQVRVWNHSEGRYEDSPDVIPRLLATIDAARRAGERAGMERMKERAAVAVLCSRHGHRNHVEDIQANVLEAAARTIRALACEGEADGNRNGTEVVQSPRRL